MGLFYYAQKKKEKIKKGNALNSNSPICVYTLKELLDNFKKHKDSDVWFFHGRSNDVISDLTGGKISSSSRGFICKQSTDMCDIVAACGPYGNLIIGRLEISKNTFSYKNCNLGAGEKVEILN